MDSSRESRSLGVALPTFLWSKIRAFLSFFSQSDFAASIKAGELGAWRLSNWISQTIVFELLAFLTDSGTGDCCREIVGLSAEIAWNKICRGGLGRQQQPCEMM